LYLLESKTLVLPCVDLFELFIHHADAKKFLLNNKDEECIGIFFLIEVCTYYKLKEVEDRLNKYFLVAFYEKNNTDQLGEDKKFVNKALWWYNIVNLQEPYIFLMALICRLYGEKDFSGFSEAWMSLAHMIATYGSTFNWGVIISKQLSTRI